MSGSTRFPSSRFHAAGVIVASLLTLTNVVGAAEMPTRKAGLWEIKIQPPGGQIPAQTMQQCTDETTDKDMTTSSSPMAKEACATQNIQKTATGMVIDSTCTISGVTSTTHIEVTGDFNSAYSMKITPAGAKASTTMDAKWLGPCRPDQKAGDMIMPGGIKINIKDMQKLQGMMPRK